MSRFSLAASFAAILILFGVAGSANAQGVVGQNVLTNPSFDSPGGWSGSFSRSTSNPHSGSHCARFHTNDSVAIYQDFSLDGYDEHRLHTGGYYIYAGGYNQGALFSTGKLTVEQSGSGAEPTKTWEVNPGSSWNGFGNTTPLAQGAESLRFKYTASSALPIATTESFVDDVSLVILEYGYWTWGDCRGLNEDGNGTWNLGSSFSVGYESEGSIDITNNSVWNTGGSAHIGHYAEGTINVNNGGRWNSDIAFVGTWRRGNVNITDGGIWTTSGETQIGFEEYGGSGRVTIASGGFWQSNGAVRVGHLGVDGEVTLDDGGNWSAAGSVYVGSYAQGTLTVNTGGRLVTNNLLKIGTHADNTGTMNLDGGEWRAKSNVVVGGAGQGTLNLNDGSLMTVTGGTLTVNERGKFIFNGGTLDLGVDLVQHGEIDFDSGNLHVTGTLTGLNGQHSGDVDFSILDGGVWQTSGVTLSEGMPVNMAGGSLEIGTGRFATIYDQMTFTDSGSSIIMDDSYLMHPLHTLLLHNDGVISGSGEIFVGDAGLHMDGSLLGTSDTERLRVYGNISGTGTLTNTTVFGDISVGNSPGRMFADGLTLTGSGTLAMELGGLLAGTEYDQIVANGLLTVDGILDIVWYDGFEAVLGDTFTLFDLTSGGTINGTFASINLPSFSDPDLSWGMEGLYTIGQIYVVPEPTAIALLAFGALATVRRRGNKR